MDAERVARRARDYRASWEAGRRAVRDPHFMAELRRRIIELERRHNTQ